MLREECKTCKRKAACRLIEECVEGWTQQEVDDTVRDLLDLHGNDED